MINRFFNLILLFNVTINFKTFFPLLLPLVLIRFHVGYCVFELGNKYFNIITMLLDVWMRGGGGGWG